MGIDWWETRKSRFIFLFIFFVARIHPFCNPMPRTVEKGFFFLYPESIIIPRPVSDGHDLNSFPKPRHGTNQLFLSFVDEFPRFLKNFNHQNSSDPSCKHKSQDSRFRIFRIQNVFPFIRDWWKFTLKIISTLFLNWESTRSMIFVQRNKQSFNSRMRIVHMQIVGKFETREDGSCHRWRWRKGVKKAARNQFGRWNGLIDTVERGPYFARLGFQWRNFRVESGRLIRSFLARQSFKTGPLE